MNVEIIERNPTAIAYLRHVGPYGEALSAFWQTEVYPWMVASGLLGQPRYGISHDDPLITAPEQCRYDAGCEIPPNFIALSNAHKSLIPGGRYAALNFKGVVSEFGTAWNSLLRDWLPNSGLATRQSTDVRILPSGIELRSGHRNPRLQIVRTRGSAVTVIGSRAAHPRGVLTGYSRPSSSGHFPGWTELANRE